MGTIRRLAHIKNPMALIRENTGPVLPNMFTWKWLPAGRFNVQDPAERCELMGKMLQEPQWATKPCTMWAFPTAFTKSRTCETLIPLFPLKRHLHLLFMLFFPQDKAQQLIALALGAVPRWTAMALHSWYSWQRLCSTGTWETSCFIHLSELTPAMDRSWSATFPKGGRREFSPSLKPTLKLQRSWKRSECTWLIKELDLNKN